MNALEETILWWLLRRWRARGTETTYWTAITQAALADEREAVNHEMQVLLWRIDRLRKAERGESNARAAIVDAYQMPRNHGVEKDT